MCPSIRQLTLMRCSMKNYNAHGVKTSLIKRLTKADAGPKLPGQEHGTNWLLVGSLLYLAIWMRPDITFTVSELPCCVSEQFQAHLSAAKCLLQYLHGTCDISLVYKGCSSLDNIMCGYMDSDWARDTESCRSMSGYVIMLNSAAIAWKSKRQQLVAMSTTEAERNRFVAVSLMVQEILYLLHLLNKLEFPQQSPTVVNEDNRTVIANRTKQDC